MNHSIDEYPEGVGGYTNKKRMTSAILSLTNLTYFYEKKMCLPLLYAANIRLPIVNRIEAMLKNIKIELYL